MPRFTGKTAFVTGAAHGIGLACATRLAAEDAHVVIADLDTTAARRANDDIDGTTTAVTCDVTDTDSINHAIEATIATTGGIDILINNVGIAEGRPFTDLDDDAFTRVVDPTLAGALRCVRACLPHLLTAHGGGAVVSIASVNGMAAVGEIAYSAAKAGLINASANLAVQYGRRNATSRDHGWARFNIVAPGTIRTRVWTDNGPDQAARLEHLRDLYPAGRIGEPDDIAAAVAFLASTEADWITGITLPVDGGLTAGPAAVNTILDR